jgi:hypothetical protein
LSSDNTRTDDSLVIPKDTTQWEPILNDDNPKWLAIITKYELSAEESLKRTPEENILDPLGPEKKIYFHVEEPNQYLCRKCGCRFKGGMDPPLECPESQGGCGRASSFAQITKNVNITRWRLPHWIDIPTDEIDMLGTYTRIVNIVKRSLVFPEEKLYEIYALWIIASYKSESFDTIPFLIFRGLVESGKTRALDIIREIGYRMIHCTGVTFPAMVRYTHYHHAGLLLDEIDTKINTRTEIGQAMLDFLKPSYRRGSIYAVADKEDQEETKEYQNFGFKAFAGERGGFDFAIDTRSIKFYMEQDYPEILDLKEIQKEFDEIRTILINYRYKTTDPPPLPDDIDLKGRTRELFECIIRIAMHIGLDTQSIIEFINERTEQMRIEQQETREYILLKAIRELGTGVQNPRVIGDDTPEYLQYSDLADHIGWEDKQRQRMGYIFKKLGLRTKRMNTGSVLILNDEKNQKKLKSLYRRFRL